MNKQNNDDEVKKETSESANAETSEANPKDKKSNKILFWVCLFLLAGAVAYAVTPVLLPYLSEASVFNQNESESLPEAPLPTDTIAEETGTAPVNTFFVDDEYNPDDMAAPLTTENIPDVSISGNEQTITADVPEHVIAEPIITKPAAPMLEADLPTLNQPQVEPTQLVPQAQPVVSAPSNTLKPETQHTKRSDKFILLKLIQLDESIRNGNTCRELANELLVLNTEPDMDQQLLGLVHICLEEPLATQMHNAFYRNKKQAILRILKNENALFMAYLKMIPYSLIDVQKKTVIDDSAFDMLYQLQNAVQNNQFAQVLEFIDKLPTNVQPVFYDLKQSALRGNQASLTIQYLIQNLTTEGDNHE